MRHGCACLALVASLLVIALAGTPAPARAHEHLPDGGFEHGGAGWETSGMVLIDSGAADGATHARAVLGSDGAWLSSSAPGLLPPGRYEVSLALRGADPSVQVRIYVALYAPDGDVRELIAQASPRAEWAWVETAFDVAAPSTAKIEMRASGPAGAHIDIDAVSVDGAPPQLPTATPTFTPFVPSAGATSATPRATASAAFATATAYPVPADQIGPDLRNSGFESLDPESLPVSWQKYGGVLASDMRSRGGERAGRLESSTGSTKWLYQTVTVDAGATYAFEAWVLHDDPAVAAASLRISWYANADGSGEALSTDDSVERLTSPFNNYRVLTTGPVTAPADAASARLRVLLAPYSETPASIVVDDAWFGATAVVPPSFTPVPATGVAPAASTRAGRADANGASPSSRVAGTTRFAAPPVGLLRASQSVVINEVLYDAQGDLPDGDAEWVELYNRSDAPVDVSGWTLRDGAGVEGLPSLVIPARGFAVVAATDAFPETYPSYAGPLVTLGGRIGNGLGNDGDRLLLIDPSGAVADAMSWGADGSAFEPPVEDVPEGHSVERRVAGVDSDSASDFVDNHRPSPGEGFVFTVGNPQPQADAGTQPQVEVLAGETSGPWRWLPWAALALASAGLVAAVAWRIFAAPRPVATGQP